MLLYTCIGHAHADLVLENTGQQKMVAYVYWVNHPYGCRSVFGSLKCEVAVVVGEMEPGKKWTVLKNYHWTPGKIFVVVFQKPTYLDDGFIYMKRFTVTEDLAQVYMNQNAFGLAWK